jgi:putative protease
VELLAESAEQTQNLVTLYSRVLAGIDDGRELWRKLRLTNRVGLTRGTLSLA